MNKKGFTLAEILVALGIIGITAAITAPILNSLMPDKHKAMVLKYYKTITDINKDLLTDPFYYYDYTSTTPNNDKYVYLGLSSFWGNCEDYKGLCDKVGDSEYNNKYKKELKYCYLLAENLELSDQTIIKRNKELEYELINGTTVVCKSLYTSPTVNPGGETYYDASYILTFDINGEDGPKSVGSKTQKKPDQFKFYVDNYGIVTGGDNLTKQYLKNPHKLNDKKADYDAAFNS